MFAVTEDTDLIRYAVAYVIELYQELASENGAPSLGTQNQTVDFILADPELCAAVAQWGRACEIDEAGTTPAPRLRYDAAYWRIKAHLQSIMEQPVVTRPGREPADRR
jgi:hypothetical protein